MDFIYEIDTKSWITAYLVPLAIALITLVIGWIIVGIITNVIAKAIRKSVHDEQLSKFLVSLVSVLLKVLLLVSVAGRLGLETTSFAAIIGAAGLAIGLALQGSLSNFAGGVIILIFKPFKVGELITGAGHTGKVAEIQIFNTIMYTADNKMVIIPNGQLSNSSVVNFSRPDTRRIDLAIGIGYGENAKKAEEVLLKVAEEHPLVLKDPAPVVLMMNLGDSSVDLSFRIWGKGSDFFTIMTDVLEQSKEALDAADIEIPFPQRVVHQVNNQ